MLNLVGTSPPFHILVEEHSLKSNQPGGIDL